MVQMYASCSDQEHHRQYALWKNARRCWKPKGETGELEWDLTYRKPNKLLRIFRYGHMKVSIIQVYLAWSSGWIAC